MILRIPALFFARYAGPGATPGNCEGFAMKTAKTSPMLRTGWTTACLLVVMGIAPETSADAPACPSDGTAIFSQLPDLDHWTLAFSNVVAGYGGLRYDNFSGVDQRITGVRFWGMGFQYYYAECDRWWGQCLDDPMVFDVRLYKDASGAPGAVVYSGTFSLTGTLAASVGYPQFDLYEYTATLETPVTLQRGWISIAGPGSCWFAWMNSADGDGRSRLSWSLLPSAWGFDLALCLMTDFAPVYGACCQDMGAGCQTDVLMSDCHGRFIAGGTCDDFNPSCGQITGACCRADGTCDVLPWEGCEGFCAGDLDCSGAVGFSDINPFVLALSSPPAYLAQYPNCPLRNGDCTGDGIVNFAAINAFITRIGAVCTPQAGTWLGAGTACAACPPPPIVCPASLPYSDTNSTCGREDNFDATCLGPYDGGAEIVYELRVPDQPVDVEITLLLDPNDTPYTGLLLADHWPPDGACLAMSTSAAAATHTLGCQHFDPGTYYVMVDNWPAPDCSPHFTLQVTACTPVIGRCCFVDRAPCAEITAAACTSLGGTWTAGIDCTTPCPSIDGEDCAHAMPIPLVPFSRSFTNNTMTSDGPAATCDKYGRRGSMVNDAWFVWTAEGTCYATATVTADYDAVLIVRDGCDGSELRCAEGGGTGFAETVSFPAMTGTTYYFQVGTAGNHPGGGLNHFALNCTNADGACCFSSGLCLSMSGLECLAQGGTYQGDNVSCAAANCRAPQPGDNCALPRAFTLNRACLPYVDTNTTVGCGNDYADTCLGSYDSGEDILYELTVTETLVVTIKMDPRARLSRASCSAGSARRRGTASGERSMQAGRCANCGTSFWCRACTT